MDRVGFAAKMTWNCMDCDQCELEGRSADLVPEWLMNPISFILNSKVFTIITEEVRNLNLRLSEVGFINRDILLLKGYIQKEGIGFEPVSCIQGFRF